MASNAKRITTARMKIASRKTSRRKRTEKDGEKEGRRWRVRTNSLA